MSLDKPQHILRPVRAGTIVMSFVVAMLLNFLPWQDLRLVPDFVALVLAFWCVHQPRLVGLGVGWTLGLVCDAGNGVLLGQYALSYALLAFFAITLSRRILWFGLFQQALHAAALLVFSQAIVVLVRIAAGSDLPGWQVFFGPLGAAALWPVTSWLLLMPQRSALEPEETI